MANIHDWLPAGAFIKVAQLKGRECELVIDQCVHQTIGDEQKPVLYFEGKDAGLPLNVTNANTLIDAYGPETDDWRGQRVVLFPTTTDYQGKHVACMRLKVPVPDAQSPNADDDLGF